VADIFQEVDEDLRRDKHEELWAKYGKYVIAVALAIVLATAANVGWREYSKSQRLADGERFAAAKALVGEGREAEAVAAFATLAADAGGGYAVIAKFEQATAQARSGDIAAAVSTYDQISADGSDQVYRELASLLAAGVLLDEGDVSGARQRLEPLTGSSKVWRHSALELVAVAALADGDTASAIKTFKELSDDAAAPQGVRARAAEMLAAVGGSE